MNLAALLEHFAIRFPRLFAFISDPLAQVTFTSPVSNRCYGVRSGDPPVVNDLVIDWDVSVGFTPGWNHSVKVFKFNADGTTAPITFSWLQNPIRLKIAKGDHGITTDDGCLDLLIVVRQIEDVPQNPKTRVAGVCKISVCGKCPVETPHEG